MTLVILFIVVLHIIISFTAAYWWLRPVMLWFDKKMTLPHCKESDFFFYCWSWSLVLILMGMYVVWEVGRGLLSKWFKH